MFEKQIVVGLAYYGSKIQYYVDWLKSLDSNVAIKNLHHLNNTPEDLLECTSLLLPGGSDVNPMLYGQNNDLVLSRNIDDDRDKFERELLEVALKNKLPILGICRGLQLVNVHLGGTLHQDIPNHKGNEGSDLDHIIKVFDNSLLKEITGTDNGKVNSSHHQAVDKVADDLVVTTVSENDNVIESLEWKDKENKYPLLLVQWHPERMSDKSTNPFSKGILNWFLKCQIN